MPDLFLTNYKLTAEVGISNVGGTWTYAPLSNGIDNIAEALNEIVQEYQFLSNQGFGQDHVTGMHPVFTFSGRRILGDAAQDYIASVKYKMDTDRESSFRISYVDASSGTNVTPLVTVDCTFKNIQDIAGGAATDDSVFSVDISFKGAPTLNNVGVLPALKVVSVAGTTGKTSIYVNPALTGTDTYVYKVAAAVTLPTLGVAPGSGWAAWNGTDQITAVTGNQIGIVEVSTGGLSVKGGLATVTAG